MKMWKLSFILLLAVFCNAQEVKVNPNEAISGPFKTTDDVPKAEISTAETVPLSNEEVNVPGAENNKEEPINALNTTENKIEETNMANPTDEKIVVPMPSKPEHIPTISDESLNPPEVATPSEVTPNPVEIPNIPEVILVSGEPVPIASNDEIIVSQKPELKPEDSICIKRNSYYKVDGSCDAYIECREYISRDMLCPDGMHYNPDAKWPEYPCYYSMDVSCTGRGNPQEASPTEHCPHRFGFYPPLEITPKDCGRYRMCVDGNSVDMMCPAGLAYNPDISRCDWPENVASCESEAFLGFKCPPHPVDPRGQPLDVVLNFRHEKDCHIFYSCKEGRARLLSCDLGFAFEPTIGRCVDSELVPCPYDPKTDPRKIFF